MNHKVLFNIYILRIRSIHFFFSFCYRFVSFTKISVLKTTENSCINKENRQICHSQFTALCRTKVKEYLWNLVSNLDERIYAYHCIFVEVMAFCIWILGTVKLLHGENKWEWLYLNKYKITSDRNIFYFFNISLYSVWIWSLDGGLNLHLYMSMKNLHWF